MCVKCVIPTAMEGSPTASIEFFIWLVLLDTGAALRRSFGFAQDDSAVCEVCNPDRNGGISNSWQQVFFIWLVLSDTGAALKRSFGYAQDDRVTR